MTNLLLFFLIAHFLGDYTLQPRKLVELKNEKIRYLFIHSFIYSILFFLILFIYAEILNALIFTVAIFIVHFIVDFLRILIGKEIEGEKKNFCLFIIDQLVHIGIIVLLFELFYPYITKVDGDHVAEWFGILFNSTGETALMIILAYIFILTPVSVFVKHFFARVFGPSEEETGFNTGAIIGKLERVLILTLGIMGLFSSIAIVLAAKSLARFKQLEDRDFAEKYLVGTLLSMILAIIPIAIISVM